MVAASIVKSVQSINKMRALVEEGIAEKDWIAAIISNTFETGNPPKEGETDLDRGDFDVVKALIKKYPEMALGEILTDKMVDLAGQTGPHLYKCVTEMQVQRPLKTKPGERWNFVTDTLGSSAHQYDTINGFGI